MATSSAWREITLQLLEQFLEVLPLAARVEERVGSEAGGVAVGDVDGLPQLGRRLVGLAFGLGGRHA